MYIKLMVVNSGILNDFVVMGDVKQKKEKEMDINWKRLTSKSNVFYCFINNYPKSMNIEINYNKAWELIGN